jgi:transglutaminase-like putative cysteine protease
VWQNPRLDAPEPAVAAERSDRRDRAEVGCELVFDVADHVSMAVQVAVASTAGIREVEELDVALDGRPVDVEEIEVDHGGRVHLVRCGAGRLTLHYRALVQPARPADRVVGPAEALVALRQSRYCPSDALESFAAAELRDLGDGPDQGRAVGAWVFERLRYESGSSGFLDTAVDTLLAGRGVCRDFAHLTVALCRAVGIPARLAAVYAPGIFPMDFHAVAEIVSGDRWEVVDATRLAPRQSLVRIGTGRDAADTAFATTLAGSADLVATSISASTMGALPLDDHVGPIALA